MCKKTIKNILDTLNLYYIMRLKNLTRYAILKVNSTIAFSVQVADVINVSKLSVINLPYSHILHLSTFKETNRTVYCELHG